uniref:Uncharacterized protein n=1 Tax=Moniliophthora roreri TaxID=221103 RepID=A0A0W0EYY4_MONRR
MSHSTPYTKSAVDTIQQVFSTNKDASDNNFAEYSQ